MIPRSQFLILSVLSLIFALSPISDVVFGDARELVLQRPAGRSLLSYPLTEDVELAAAPNGTVFLVHSDTKKVLWSFPSGPPIYMSYRPPIQPDEDKDHALEHSRYSFVDSGDDWELYMHNNYGKLKLGGTIEDYVKKTPIYEDDEVTVGSMHSAVFKVDLHTGMLIYDYGKSTSSSRPKGGTDASSVVGSKEEEGSDTLSVKGTDVELYIERTDYSLSTKAFDKLLWNLTIGFFKAKVRCRGTGHLFGEASLDLDYKLGSGSNTHRIISLPCGFEFPVLRFRKQSTFDYFLRLDGSVDLPADAPSHLLPSIHKDDETSATHEKAWSLPEAGHHRPGMREVLEIGTSTHTKRVNTFKTVRRFVPLSLMVLVVLLVGYAFHHKSSAMGQKFELNVEPTLSSQPVSSRRRRSRKSGRSVSGLEEGQTNERFTRRWPDLNSLVQSDTNGRTIGRLLVSSREIAKGSNGTVVYEGIYDGRKVAVKRMVQAHHDVAFREIQNLIASDQHPNVVRWYGVEYDPDFVYVALEHCSCNLNDLIESFEDSSQNFVTFNGKGSSAMMEHRARVSSVKAIMPHIKLWKSNGHPSVLLLKLMRDVVSGLVHLHDLGIIHRDIKPQNVLINNDKALCAKLSDMGISKRLLADMSSLGHHATGHGSSGWQAPEQLLHGRQTRAVDMFSVGCVLFFCVTGGKHPFGDRYERDANIIKNQVDLFLVENMPEALELLARLLQPDPQLRPKAFEVLLHPFFWKPETRLSFLHDASDRVELEDRESSSAILQALERVGSVAIGSRWNEKLEPDFISNIGRYRRYNYESVRDLLRVMRNKLNHYRELPADIQALLGPVPDGFDEYFSTRFPRLLIEVYKVVYKYCRAEKWFQKYLEGA